MALARKQYWDTRHFHEFLLERAKQPFAWGSNDCATFAADGIQAIASVDIMAELRGYRSSTGAMKKIRDVTGGTTLADAVAWCAAKYELTEREHPLMAQRGDLVLYRNGDGELASGLVHLNGRHIISPGEKELLRMPIGSVARAWSY